MSSSKRDTWLILAVSLFLSVLFITFFLKILKGLLLLVLILLVLPVMYLLVKAFISGSKRLVRGNKLKERM